MITSAITYVVSFITYVLITWPKILPKALLTSIYNSLQKISTLDITQVPNLCKHSLFPHPKQLLFHHVLKTEEQWETYLVPPSSSTLTPNPTLSFHSILNLSQSLCLLSLGCLHLDPSHLSF